MTMEQNFARRAIDSPKFDKNSNSKTAHRSSSKRFEQKKVNNDLKNMKPTQAIYRPPSVRISKDFSSSKLGSNHSGCDSPTDSLNSSVSDDSTSTVPQHRQKSSTHVHFGRHNQISPSHTLKSTKGGGNLKRSKSFGATDQVYMTAISFDKDSFFVEGNGFIRKACEDPNKLSCRQLMEVVRVICNRAVESFKNAEPAAQLCLSIIEKDMSSTFVESLLNSCREWFNEKDKVLRGPLSVAGMTGPAQKWISYVTFLSELYKKLKDWIYRMPNLSPETNNLTITLNMLLYECFKIIMKPPSIHNIEEVQCMHLILTKMGRLLDNECSHRMRSLIMSMRDAYLNPSISLNGTVKKLLLELVELQASRWQFDMPQSVYYFPYTTKT